MKNPSDPIVRRSGFSADLANLLTFHRVYRGRDDDYVDGRIARCGWCGRDKSRPNRTILECGWCGSEE